MLQAAWEPLILQVHRAAPGSPKKHGSGRCDVCPIHMVPSQHRVELLDELTYSNIDVVMSSVGQTMVCLLNWESDVQFLRLISVNCKHVMVDTQLRGACVSVTVSSIDTKLCSSCS